MFTQNFSANIHCDSRQNDKKNPRSLLSFGLLVCWFVVSVFWIKIYDDGCIRVHIHISVAISLLSHRLYSLCITLSLAPLPQYCPNLRFLSVFLSHQRSPFCFAKRSFIILAVNVLLLLGPKCLYERRFNSQDTHTHRRSRTRMTQFHNRTLGTI